MSNQRNDAHQQPGYSKRPRRPNAANMLYIMLLFLAVSRITAAENDWKPTRNTQSQAELFVPSDAVKVTAPSHFPKPTRPLGNNATVIVEPTFGEHRPDQDAILAYAEGYRLSYYMQFLETLTATGFRGDVVLAIAEERIIRENVVEYLQTFSRGDTNKPNVVVYQQDLKCQPRDGQLANQRQVTKTGDTDSFQMCQLSHVYGWRNGDVKAEDPRAGRVVATLRYEWYWIWSLQYRPHKWLMLIDARDTFFQSNPFAGLPRQDDSTKNGLLYFFGENARATRLGKSRKNMQWIRKGYGQAALEALKDKPTICSGSTMGEQIAVETYLRAMVNEHDECNIKMTGSDQGFHNYLYYSSKLTQADTIRRIVVWEQGRGIINNLGAMRTQSLTDWGIMDPKRYHVYQWDGETQSPVVHQWDRDKELHGYIYGRRHREWTEQWSKYQQKHG